MEVFCDFDGTISVQDATGFILSRFADREWQDIEAQWKKGAVGSAQCIQRQVALIRATRRQLDAAPFQRRCGDRFRNVKFSTVPGMPTASLDIDFTSIDEYLSRLSSSTRKDMRRKLRSLDRLRVEYRTSIDDVLAKIMTLYHDTRNRSEWQFEELTPGYFQGVLARMPERSFCVLYYAGVQLLAANLLIHDERTLIDKFFCMNSKLGREYNLYFLSWFTNIRYCLEHGLIRYQSGQAYYENKLRLGSRLTRNTIYFKHRNVLAQGLLRFAAPLLSADETLKKSA